MENIESNIKRLSGEINELMQLRDRNEQIILELNTKMNEMAHLMAKRAKMQELAVLYSAVA